MDPESAAFQPRDDFWRLQDDMLRMHQSQQELSDRVSRLERRNEEDLRLKNVWGGASPFPSVLGGTPQQVPLQQPTAERFSNFDDHSSALINDLHLDADEEPRRLGTTSRANSVRFDETANHGHWSRPSMELITRTGSGMGGHAMSERSYSHKSLGGQKLGFQDHVTRTDDDRRTIKLPMYLPEAVPVSASSHASSPAPQLPSLTIEFIVVEDHNGEGDSKAIQIFLGSDMLRAHNADILLSSNQLTLYDDDGSKLRIPLVRPEDEHTFKSLYTTSKPRDHSRMQLGMENPTTLPTKSSLSKEPGHPLPTENLSTSATAALKATSSATTSGSDDGSVGRRSLEQRPRLGLSTSSGTESKDVQESSPGGVVAHAGSSPAIWSNWRRDTEKSGSTDWANVGKPPAPTYQRRDTGIKVLKKPGARTLSTSISHGASPSAATGQSRFFDDGKRREEIPDESEGSMPPFKRSVSGEKPKENIPGLAKSRSANPVGGASAFPWLNTGGSR
ncbi:hypothetical protein SLS60_003992 [Paraconiothyrium brasiliense]|uniref:Ubiquitin carboxyl-terminal hydrolase 19 n=1 Tax=Paraconiothyrium brasiliense TaxID=300254 RepID=A0ABR3RQ73_9PLEO